MPYEDFAQFLSRYTARRKIDGVWRHLFLGINNSVKSVSRTDAMFWGYAKETPNFIMVSCSLCAKFRVLTFLPFRDAKNTGATNSRSGTSKQSKSTKGLSTCWKFHKVKSMDNVTYCVSLGQRTDVKEIANLALSGFTLLFVSFLTYAKKENLFDFLFPSKKPRNVKLRKLSELEARLADITAQIQNLTPPSSETDSDGRIRSSPRNDSNWRNNSGQIQLRVLEEARDRTLHGQPDTLAQPGWQAAPGAIRPQPRRWYLETHEWPFSPDSGRREAAGGHDSPGDSSSGDDHTRRPEARAAGNPQYYQSDQPTPRAPPPSPTPRP